MGGVGEEDAVQADSLRLLRAGRALDYTVFCTSRQMRRRKFVCRVLETACGVLWELLAAARRMLRRR